MRMTSFLSPMRMRGESQRALPLHINLLWTLSGNLIAAGAQWLMILALVRLDTAVSVGSYALALSVVGPIFLIANLHLRTVQATDIDNSFDFETYLLCRVSLTGLALAAAIVAMFALPWQSAVMVPCLAAIKCFEGLSDVAYGVMQRNESMDHIGKSMILRNVGVLGALVLAIRSGWGSQWGLLLGAGVSACVWMLDWRALGFRATLQLPGTISWSRVHRLIRVALPLGIALIMVSLNANIPRYFLAHVYSTVEVGQFAALAAIGLAANTLVMASGQALGPSLARAAQSGLRSEFLKRGMMLVAVACLLALGLVSVGYFGGPVILEAVYGAEYRGLSSQFVWVLVGAGLSFVASALGYLLSSARCFQPQVPMHFGISAVIVAGCWAAVPAHSITGAALALAAGYSVQVLWSLFLLNQLLADQSADRGYSNA